jgi:hypothetical protein
MNSIKKMVGVFVCGFLVLSSVPTAEAYSYNNNAAKIAELQATIVRLQAELARLQGSSYGYNTGLVTTGSAVHKGGGDIEFRGSAMDVSDTAKVWFEFGTTRSLAYSTPKLSLRGGRYSSYQFTGYADNLSRGTYYYRAVLEDRRGDTYEGMIQRRGRT